MKLHLVVPALIAAIIICVPGSLFSQETPATQTGCTISVKGVARQGGILFVKIMGSLKSQEGDVTWRGKKYALLWQKDALGVLLPVALDTPPGAYKLTVRVKDAATGETTALERIIPTKSFNNGVQHIWLSQQQYDSYDDPQAERDNSDINKALSEYTTEIKWDHNFIWPVNGYTSTQFGLRRYYNNDAKPEFHRGMDLSAGAGTPVAAAQRGVVMFARKNLLLHGTTVVIDHGKGIGTIYLHMSSLRVKKGDSVEQGDIIGAVGSTGVATGPHLHWAAYAHDEPIDPHLLFTLPRDWMDD